MLNMSHFFLLWCIFAIFSETQSFFHPNQNFARTSTLRSSGGETVINSRICEELVRELRGTSLYLVGMMGCGKSTIGNIMASKLGYRHLDTDEIAEFMIEMPIADFFDAGHESEFRNLEHRILLETSQYKNVVISTGGGIVVRNDNWGLLRHGIVVFIDLPPEDIYQRLMSKGKEQIAKRPLLRSKDPLGRLKDLHKERLEKYMQADVAVAVSALSPPDDVCDNIIMQLLTFIRENPPLWRQWKQRNDAAKQESQ